MLKRFTRCMFVLAFSLGILFVLSACGPDYTENFAGTWDVIELQDANGSDQTPVIEQLNSANKKMELILSSEDGDPASFDLAGQLTLTGTWKPKGEDTCVISFEGYDEITAKLVDGYLTFDEDGKTMKCQKQG